MGARIGGMSRLERRAVIVRWFQSEHRKSLVEDRGTPASRPTTIKPLATENVYTARSLDRIEAVLKIDRCVTVWGVPRDEPRWCR